MVTAWPLVLLAATSNVVLNLCLRETARSIEMGSPRAVIVSVASSPWAYASVVSGFALVVFFVLALRALPLSLTYTAVTALAMVVLTGIGAAMQIETISVGRAIGLGLIVAGLCLTAVYGRTAG